MKKLMLLGLLISSAAFATVPSALQLAQDKLAIMQAQMTYVNDNCASQAAAGKQSQLQADQCKAQSAQMQVQIDQANAQIAKLQPSS